MTDPELVFSVLGTTVGVGAPIIYGLIRVNSRISVLEAKVDILMSHFGVSKK